MLNFIKIKKLFSPDFTLGNKTFYIFFLFLLCFCCKTKSQTNLVYNGDFEIYSSCPTSESSPSQAPNYEVTKCIGWNVASYGTSDYFNICTTNWGIDIPCNYDGCQSAYSGNAYVGGFFSSYTGGAGTDGYSGIMWWEYVQGQFTKPLVANHKYNVSIYVSLAEYSDLCIKEFGAYMSQNPITSPNTAALTVTPQVKFFNSNYFKDTINWVQVSGEFIAAGGEKYITIGNFNNNVTTDTVRRYWIDPPPLVTYFYIDNATTIDVTDNDTLINLNCIENIPTVFTPNADNVNDVLKFSLCNEILKTTIYNRWGNLIFESNKSNPFWDGRTTSGEQCIEGTYFYVIITEEKIVKGFIQLIR